MGRGIQQPSQYGQMGDRPDFNFDPTRTRAAFDQFRQDHPFPTNAGFPGTSRPVIPPPTTPPPSGPPPTFPGGGDFSGGGNTGGVWPGGGNDGGGGNGGVFPGQANGGVFPGQGGGVSDGFPGMPNFPRGATGATIGRVGNGWGQIGNRNESGPGNALSKAFSAVGSSGANRPRGSNQ